MRYNIKPYLFAAFLFSLLRVTYAQVGPGGPECFAAFEFTTDCPEVSFNSTSLGSVYQGPGPQGPDAQIVSEFWDFGDGTTGTGSQTTHLYIGNGIYYVCLTIIDEYQCSDEYCDTIEISCISEPECNAGFQIDSIECPDFSFINTSIIDSDDQIVLYSWDFGDGITNTNSDPSHIYEQNDIYAVCLFIETENGCSDQFCDTIIIDCIACNSQFELDSSDCPNIIFYDQSTINSSDQIWSYNWSFGDGINSSSINPNHMYTSNGIYSVCLNIETMFDCESEFCTEIDISCINTVSIEELTNSKSLFRILDFMGRETTFKPHTPLIHVYDDGSTERVFGVED